LTLPATLDGVTRFAAERAHLTMTLSCFWLARRRTPDVVGGSRRQTLQTLCSRIRLLVDFRQLQHIVVGAIVLLGEQARLNRGIAQPDDELIAKTCSARVDNVGGEDALVRQAT